MLPELWHVQMTKNGGFVGYYQFFHPNESAAQKEAERLRTELASLGAEVHVGRYVLDAHRPDKGTPAMHRPDPPRTCDACGIVVGDNYITPPNDPISWFCSKACLAKGRAPRPSEAESGPKPDCDNCHGTGKWSDILQDIEMICPCTVGPALKSPRSNEVTPPPDPLIRLCDAVHAWERGTAPTSELLDALKYANQVLAYRSDKAEQRPQEAPNARAAAYVPGTDPAFEAWVRSDREADERRALAYAYLGGQRGVLREIAEQLGMVVDPDPEKYPSIRDVVDHVKRPDKAPTPIFRQGYAAGIKQAAAVAAKNGQRAIARLIREYTPEGEQALDYPTPGDVALARRYAETLIQRWPKFLDDEHRIAYVANLILESTTGDPRRRAHNAPRSDSAPTHQDALLGYDAADGKPGGR